MLGPYSESYLPVGTLLIEFKHHGDAKEYYREPNVNDAISNVTYEEGLIIYTREYFASITSTD